MFIFASASEKFADKSKEETNLFNLTSKKAKYLYDFLGGTDTFSISYYMTFSLNITVK